MVYPGAFIPTAEETGLIIPITRLTVERACRDLKEWQTRWARHLELTVSVNISSRHFLLPTLLDDLKEVLEMCGLPPRPAEAGDHRNGPDGGFGGNGCAWRSDSGISGSASSSTTSAPDTRP